MQQTIQGYLLSPQQIRLLADGRDPHTVRVEGTVRIKGRLRSEGLRQALEQTVARHEILRTKFQTVPGMKWPLQVVEEEPVCSWTESDAREEQAADFERTASQAALPVAAALLRTGEEEYLLHLSLSALCADSLSVLHVLREVIGLYAQEEATGSFSEVEEPLQYGEYAQWAAELPETEEGAQGREFWQTVDCGGLSESRLSCELAGASEGGAPETVELLIEESMTRRLQGLADRWEVALPDVLFGAWYVLCRRLLDLERPLIGRVFDGRTFEELEAVPGRFAKTIPVGVTLEESEPFDRAVLRLSEQVQELAEWQDTHGMTANGIVPEGAPIRFQAVERPSLWQANGVTFALESIRAFEEPCSLQLFALIGQDPLSLSLHLTYDSSKLTCQDAERTAASFLTLLGGIVEAPERPLFQLPVVSPAERDRLLKEWNETAVPFPEHLCAHQLFEAHAAQHPEAQAAVCGGESLTYAELNERANRLARYLQKQGVGPDVLVGLCLERRLELPVAMLGVLKAGGAYVPLDPGYPQERLDYMLSDSGAKVLLTQSSLADRFLNGERLVLPLDTGWGEVAAEAAEDLPCAASPDNLCYVIYTSGSTGLPKGTLIEHRGVVNYADFCRTRYPLAAGNGAPVHSSVAFDLTVTSLLVPLTAGRAVVLIPDGAGVQALGDLLRDTGDFSLVKITPAHLNLLNQQLRPEETKGRTRAFILGGENLLADSLQMWREHAPETVLINEYGPTEAVVGCVVHEVTADERLTGSVPIGRPIQNVQIYLLDRDLQPVPTGVAGELYIGGVSVARGYLNRPEMTAQRFLPDPFSSRAGARLYKTGDLARYRPDGVLEYLGRLDDQVKIRGYRIELGEIETALDEQPGVRESVVIAREDIPGDQRLVAYAVADEGVVPQTADLRRALAARLPEYMVPSDIVLLDALPLTANGKIDRRQLPAPGEVISAAGEPCLAPRNRTEHELKGLWDELLGKTRYGVRDDFFRIGGHSLLAVKMIAQIRQRFDYDLSLAALFESATIEKVAALIQGIGGREPSSLVPLQPAGTQAPFFCVHAGTGNALAYLELSRSLPDDQPFYAFQAAGLDDDRAPETSITGMAAQYLKEVRREQPQGPYRLGGWCLGGLIAFEMARMLQADGEEVELLALIDAAVPIPLDLPATPDERSYLLWWLQANAADFGLESTDGLEALDDEALNELLSGILEVSKREGSVPDGLEMPQFRRLLRVFGGIKQAHETFRPSRYTGSAVLYRAAEQPPELAGDPALGWGDWIEGLEVAEMPGDHDSMMEHPHVASLADDLAQRLCGRKGE